MLISVDEYKRLRQLDQQAVYAHELPEGLSSRYSQKNPLSRKFRSGCLKHIASSVRLHQQFRNTDVLTIRVEAVKRAASGNLI